MWGSLFFIAGTAFSPGMVPLGSPLGVSKLQPSPKINMAGWNDPYDKVREKRGDLKVAENDFDAMLKKQEQDQVKLWGGAFVAFLVIFGGVLTAQIAALG